MKLISIYEKHILQKFKKTSNISSDKERMILNKYAGIGFVQFGFNWDTMSKTAKLTNSGMKHLNK